MGLKYTVPAWILSSIPEPLKLKRIIFSPKEKEDLGLDAVVKFYEIREELGESLQRANEMMCHDFPLTADPSDSYSRTCQYCLRKRPIDMARHSRTVIMRVFKEAREVSVQ